MFNVNDDKFQDGGKSLVFNNGVTGVVEGCLITVSKKTAKDHERAPDYKIIVKDKVQIENKDKVEEDKIYPVNKGYYYQDEFKSEKAEVFFVKELKHLLKMVDHPTNEDGELKFEKSFSSYNDFLDYTMKYIATSSSSKTFDVVVDYGKENYPQKFLQLNGYPYYICRSGSMKLTLSKDALTERPKDDSESPFKGDTDDTSKSDGMDWLSQK